MNYFFGFFTFVISIHSLAASIPYTNEHGELTSIEVPDEFSAGLAYDGIEFISTVELGQRIKNRSGHVMFFLGNHEGYETKSYLFAGSRMGQFYPKKSDGQSWEYLTYVGVGPLDNSLMLSLSVSLEFAEDRPQGEPEYFLFMQKSDFDEYVEERLAHHSMRRSLTTKRMMANKLKATIAVIPDFIPGSIRHTAETIVSDAIINSHNFRKFRMGSVFAFEGGKFEEAIIARTLAEIAYVPESRRPKTLSIPFPLYVELWPGLQSKEDHHANFAATNLTLHKKEFETLPLEGAAMILFGNYEDGGFMQAEDISDFILRYARTEIQSEKEYTSGQWAIIEKEGEGPFMVSGSLYVNFLRDDHGLKLTLHVDQLKHIKHQMGNLALLGISVEGKELKMEPAKHKYESEFSTYYKTFSSSEGSTYIDESFVKEIGRKLKLTFKVKQETQIREIEMDIDIPRTGAHVRAGTEAFKDELRRQIAHSLARKRHLIAIEMVGEADAGRFLALNLDSIEDIDGLETLAKNHNIDLKLFSSKSMARLKVIHELDQQIRTFSLEPLDQPDAFVCHRTFLL